MKKRNLEISFRKGKALAAYFYLLPPKARSAVASTREVRPGILIDLTREGSPVGLEILNPNEATRGSIDEVLHEFGEPILENSEFEPLDDLREGDEKSSSHFYRLFGITTYHAQTFDFKLNCVLYLIERSVAQRSKESKGIRLRKDLSSSTLRTMLSHAREQIGLDESYTDLFEKARSSRSYLIHDFFPIRFAEMGDVVGRERLESELQSMKTLFIRAEVSADKVLEQIRRQMGWEQKTADRLVHEYIVEFRSKRYVNEEGAI